MANWQSASNKRFIGKVNFKVNVGILLSDEEVETIDTCVRYAAKAVLHSPNYSFLDRSVVRVRNNIATFTDILYTIELHKEKTLNDFLATIEDYVAEGTPERVTYGNTRFVSGLGINCDVQVEATVTYRHVFSDEHGRRVYIETDGDDAPTLTYGGYVEDYS